MGTEAEKELTLQEEVAAAFTATEADDTGGQPRGPDGRFEAKQGEKEVDAAARLEPEDGKQKTGQPKEEGKQESGQQKTPPEGGETKPPVEGEQAKQETGQPLLTQDKAPQGWTPAIREKWGTIPEDIRKEILRREDAVAVGVRQLQERFAPYETFANALAPFITEASQSGVDPKIYVHNVLASERILRKADIPTKFKELMRIADDYGIPLREVINASVGQEVLQKAQPQQGGALPPAIQQELTEMRTWRENFETTSIQNQIMAFAEGKEFFGDVKNQMASLLESGAAENLKDAYEAACWANPQVREVMLSRQGKEKKDDDLKNKQQAAAGASAKPAGAVDVKVDEDVDDLSAVVRSAYNSSATGRV